MLLLFSSRSRFVFLFSFNSVPWAHASNRQKDFPSLSASNSVRLFSIMKHSQWGESKHETFLRFQFASQNNHCNPLISSTVDCFIQFYIPSHTECCSHWKSFDGPGEKKRFFSSAFQHGSRQTVLPLLLHRMIKLFFIPTEEKTASHCVPVPSNASTEKKLQSNIIIASRLTGNGGERLSDTTMECDHGSCKSTRQTMHFLSSPLCINVPVQPLSFLSTNISATIYILPV